MIKQIKPIFTKSMTIKSLNLAFFLFLSNFTLNVFAEDVNLESLETKKEVVAKADAKVETSDKKVESVSDCAIAQPKVKKNLVDKVVAKVNGACILQSDLQTPKISKNGEFLTLQEAVSEELFCQKAIERKLLPTESEIERQISTLKIHNGLGDVPDDVFEEQLQEEGFSLKEYKDQLARMLAVEKLRHAEFSERVVVTAQEVETYNKNNPVRLQEKYLLKMSQVDKNLVDENGKLTKNNDSTSSDLTSRDLTSRDLKWDDLGWIEKSDLSDQLKLVTKINVGEVTEPIKMGNSYQLVKLEDKKGERVLTCDERYSEIERTLHENKKMKFEKEFDSDLRKKASIVYLS